MTDINKRIESEADKYALKHPKYSLLYAATGDGFVSGAKWWNNELIEEVIVYLQKQFPEYGNRELE